MDDKLKKEQQAQKQDAKKAKDLAKQAKKQYKLEKLTKPTDKDKKINKIASEQSAELTSKKIAKDTKKKIKVKKEKKDKPKVDYKLAFREFPVKMVKEVNKIKWSGSSNLTKKYITVILFMVIFAVVFYFVDWGLQALFSAMKVV